MSCDKICPTCTCYNESQCLDIEGDHDISQEDVDRYLAAAARAERLHALDSIYAWDHLKRVLDIAPAFDPLEG